MKEEYRKLFDTPVDRRGTHSLKWDVRDNELPMWVADMDFKTAPAIIEALQKRVEHGVFGYSIIPDEWNEAYCEWWENRHHFHIEKDWLIFSTGVVPILSSVVRKLTTPGENVLIQTPVYNIFFNSIVNNGRNVLQCPLSYENGEYSIVQLISVRFFAFQPRYSPEMKESYTVTLSVFQKASLERSLELRSSMFFVPSNE